MNGTYKSDRNSKTGQAIEYRTFDNLNAANAYANSKLGAVILTDGSQYLVAKYRHAVVLSTIGYTVIA